MNHRSTARLVGALFITATAAGILSLVLAPSTDVAATPVDPDAFAMAAAVAAIPIAIFPVIRSFSQRLGIGYVVARAIEATMVGIDVMLLMTILSVHRDLADLGWVAGLLDAQREWASVILTTAFVLSAWILNLVLFRERLVPRWLAGWGLIGTVLYAAGGVMTLFGENPLSTTVVALDAPLGIQEMSLAVYLIVRGFRETALGEPEPVTVQPLGPAG